MHLKNLIQNIIICLSADSKVLESSYLKYQKINACLHSQIVSANVLRKRNAQMTQV